MPKESNLIKEQIQRGRMPSYASSAMSRVSFRVNGPTSGLHTIDAFPLVLGREEVITIVVVFL